MVEEGDEKGWWGWWSSVLVTSVHYTFYCSDAKGCQRNWEGGGSYSLMLRYQSAILRHDIMTAGYHDH